MFILAKKPEAVFFLLAKFRQKAIFLTYGLFLAKFGPRKNIHPFWPFFIHLNPFSSTFRAFIQHLDELASGYILVVPPGRKTKNHRKNTGQKKHWLDAVWNADWYSSSLYHKWNTCHAIAHASRIPSQGRRTS
jgi:hypothetical protein